MRHLLPCLLLLVSLSPRCLNAQSYTPPQQTEWQQALFKKVSQNAARLSEAAVPALLARLDAPTVRRQLAACCPSTIGRTAEELLHTLQQEAAVAEVVSGFQSTSDSSFLSLLAGMTLEDGIHGTVFQNQWWGQLVHNRTFNETTYEYVTASCAQDAETATLQTWNLPGCLDTPEYESTLELKQCQYDPEYGMVLQYSCDKNKLTTRYWQPSSGRLGSPHHRRQPFPSRAPGGFQSRYGRFLWSPTNVTCPTSKPVAETSYIADRTCHPFASGDTSGLWHTEDEAERRLYGLKPFAIKGSPQSLVEASERGFYSMVNAQRIDQGSPLFGDVSAVFSARAVRRTALLSAIDTGFYENACNSGGFLMNLPCNCSAYTPFDSLGTADHFNHLFLINDHFWNASNALVRRFGRLEGTWGSTPLQADDLRTYWEAVPAGNMLYPHDIRFLIGNFGSLFGSSNGRLLQRWAIQRGWALVWSLGLNLGHGVSWVDMPDLDRSRISANARLLDPTVALRTTVVGGLPLTSTSVDNFQQMWAVVESLRNHSRNILNTTWAQKWNELAEALPQGLHLRPLHAGACARPPAAPECIGLSGSGQCVCYNSNPALFI